METQIIQKYARSPTLDTVLMVEKFIEDHSGEFSRRKLWQQLPKKVMWQTYLIILAYLESINKIGKSTDDVLIYIWNEKLTKIARKRPEVKL